MAGKNLYTIIFVLLFTAASAYTLFVYAYGPGQNSQPLTAEAAEGKLLFQAYNCQACHQLYGLGGYMGPDLTNVMSAPGKGEAYARALLSTGTSRMPNFHLTASEIGQLSAYLKSVDSTGCFPIYKPQLTPWGNIDLSIQDKHALSDAE